MNRTYLNRRRFIRGVTAGGLLGTGVSGSVTGGVQDASNVRVLPSTSELTVQPGSIVRFEVDPTPAEEQTPEWYVNGEQVGHSFGPWYSTYHEYNGTEFWQHPIEEDCQVTSVINPDGAGETTVSWTINTAADGLAPPEIREVRPSTAERRVLEPNTTMECELDVVDPDGNLDRVVWWAYALDIILDITSISGRVDTARIAPNSDQLVPEGVMGRVISENGLVTSSDRWLFDRYDPESQFTISSVQTNSPIGGGETLEVRATIRNTGDEGGGTPVDLIVGHSPEHVDMQWAGPDPSEETTITLEFEAGQPSGGREEFPGRITTRDDAVDFTIVVSDGPGGSGNDGGDDGDDGGQTPAMFVVQSMETNSPVGPGETLTVETTIENVGDQTGRTDIELIVGHTPQVEDSVMRTLDPGESSTFTLTFEAGQPSGGREEFPVVVNTGADSVSRSVAVVE